MSRRLVWLLVRFSVAYGLLVWLCYTVPAYAWIERAASAAVNLTLLDSETEQRSLGFQSDGNRHRYIYDATIAGKQKTLERGYHKHGFILVLFFGLALGTPGLSWRRRLGAFTIGGLATFSICAGMLMTDLQTWERAAFASEGPYPNAIVGLMNGLHRTAAGGMLPIIIWAFLVAGPVLGELRVSESEAEQDDA